MKQAEQTDQALSQCAELCARYKGGNKCEAFGDKYIPRKIINGKFDHTKPYPGDNGLRFLPKYPEDAKIQKNLFRPERIRKEDIGKKPCD